MLPKLLCWASRAANLRAAISSRLGKAPLDTGVATGTTTAEGGRATVPPKDADATGRPKKPPEDEEPVDDEESVNLRPEPGN